MADDLTPDRTAEKAWIPRFLEELSAYGNVSKAVKRAGISRSTAYEARESDEAFARAWDQAKKLGTEALEDEARRRAYEGTLKPVFQGGEKVGSVREFSDTLLIFLLKAHKPELYRETSRAMQVNVTADQLASMSDDDLDDLERKLTSAR